MFTFDEKEADIGWEWNMLKQWLYLSVITEVRKR